MLYRHNTTATHDFSAPPETLFAAIQSQNLTPTDKHAIGTFLSLKPFWGTPGEVGYQMLARINWGSADLEMTETILATDPPRTYRISQITAALTLCRHSMPVAKLSTPCKSRLMADFIIIGGGVAGTSAGAYLSQLGKVQLLEAETNLAYHASGRSAALFEESYGKPSTVALNAASRSYHVENKLLSPRGLMLAGSHDTAEAFENESIQMGLDLMSGAEAKAMVPILNTDVIDRAGYHADAWDLDTDLLIQSYVKTIRAHGGTVTTKAPVTAIEKTANGWKVTTNSETYEGAILVNAAGPWVDQIARMAGIAPIGFTALRRSMGRIPAPGGHDVSSWPMIFGAGEAWYAKPDAGALIVSPAEEDPMEPHDAFVDDMVLAEGMARYEACVTEPVTRLLASWAGFRTFSPDRTLVLGREPSDESFIWCAGQGGYGMQSSPAAGQLLADLLNGKTPAIDAGAVAALSPKRFR